MICFLGCQVAHAENWTVRTSISAVETYTTNVNLAPSGQAHSDFITELTPALTVNGSGARVSVRGTLSATGVAYARESQNSRVVPQVGVVGTVEALEKFFYVEAAVTASQTYLSPFGPQQPGNVNINQNRYTYTEYRLSPYIQGTLPGSIAYLVRNDSSWTDTSSAPTSVNNAYANHTVARASQAPTPWGWSAELTRDYSTYPDQPSIIQTKASATSTYLIDPQLEIFATGGYEWDNFATLTTNNAIYGGGAIWRPTQRTTVSAKYEHRFFGASYLVQFDHRLFHVGLGCDQLIAHGRPISPTA